MICVDKKHVTNGDVRETKNLEMPQLCTSSQISPAAYVRMCANKNTLTSAIGGSSPAVCRKPAILILKPIVQESSHNLKPPKDLCEAVTLIQD